MTDPVENLNCYVMVHGGIDRHDRLLDVEWIRDLVNTATSVVDSSHERAGEAFNNNVDRLREVLRRNERH